MKQELSSTQPAHHFHKEDTIYLSLQLRIQWFPGLDLMCVKCETFALSALRWDVATRPFFENNDGVKNIRQKNLITQKSKSFPGQRSICIFRDPAWTKVVQHLIEPCHFTLLRLIYYLLLKFTIKSGSIDHQDNIRSQ